jgi:hypothetical protein
VANILQKCKEIGIVRNGAVLRNLESAVIVESGAFTNEMFGILKIIRIGASGLEQSVRMELLELQKLVDFRDNNFYGARILETLLHILLFLQETFVSKSIQVVGICGGMVPP